MSYEQLCALRVQWYLVHGRYTDRITTDKNGITYVIGDWAWNYQHSDHQEYIE